MSNVGGRYFVITSILFAAGFVGVVKKRHCEDECSKRVALLSFEWLIQRSVSKPKRFFRVVLGLHSKDEKLKYSFTGQEEVFP